MSHGFDIQLIIPSPTSAIHPPKPCMKIPEQIFLGPGARRSSPSSYPPTFLTIEYSDLEIEAIDSKHPEILNFIQYPTPFKHPTHKPQPPCLAPSRGSLQRRKNPVETRSTRLTGLPMRSMLPRIL